MTFKLPEPDMNGPPGTGDYFQGYTISTAQAIAQAAYTAGQQASAARTSSFTEQVDSVMYAHGVLPTLKVRIAELEAKIAAMEGQDPVGLVTADGFSMLFGHKQVAPGQKLYLAPGAKP